MRAKAPAPQMEFHENSTGRGPFFILHELGLSIRLDFLRSMRGMVGTLTLRGRKVYYPVRGKDDFAAVVRPYSR